MMAVQTCTLVEPSAMNSAASRQLAMPPMPEIGRPNFGIGRAALHHVQRNGFHRRARNSRRGC